MEWLKSKSGKGEALSSNPSTIKKHRTIRSDGSLFLKTIQPDNPGMAPMPVSSGGSHHPVERG
jgi:hypothetical protein